MFSHGNKSNNLQTGQNLFGNTNNLSAGNMFGGNQAANNNLQTGQNLFGNTNLSTGNMFGGTQAANMFNQSQKSDKK
jgi:hypothetical protein